MIAKTITNTSPRYFHSTADMLLQRSENPEKIPRNHPTSGTNLTGNPQNHIESLKVIRSNVTKAHKSPPDRTNICREYCYKENKWEFHGVQADFITSECQQTHLHDGFFSCVGQPPSWLVHFFNRTYVGKAWAKKREYFCFISH